MKHNEDDNEVESSVIKASFCRVNSGRYYVVLLGMFEWLWIIQQPVFVVVCSCPFIVFTMSFGQLKRFDRTHHHFSANFPKYLIEDSNSQHPGRNNFPWRENSTTVTYTKSTRSPTTTNECSTIIIFSKDITFSIVDPSTKIGFIYDGCCQNFWYSFQTPNININVVILGNDDSTTTTTTTANTANTTTTTTQKEVWRGKS